MMNLYDAYDDFKDILKIQKFRRIVSYTGFYCFVTLLTYFYTNNTTRAGYSKADQFYASYPAGTELLSDTTKLYKAALGNCFESEDWGPIEFCIMAKHFERQGKSPYAYHSYDGMETGTCYSSPPEGLFLFLLCFLILCFYVLAAIYGTPSFSWAT